MARVGGGEILVRVFEQHGIDVVFTLHGGHLDAVYQAARGRPLRWIDTRHEQAAGHAADGWARTTGRVGVALVTAGPGVTDVVTAVTNAYLDCIPTLFLGGAAPLRDAETLPLQGGFDQVALMRPVTKWAHRVTRTHRIGDLVAQALRVATTGRPGPVFLELPFDVLFGTADEGQVMIPRHLRPDAAPAPSPAAAERAIARLALAERPDPSPSWWATVVRRRRGSRWRPASTAAGDGRRSATSAASAPACRSPYYDNLRDETR